MEKLDKKKIRDIFALTPMQEGMLFHYLKNPAGDLYFEQLNLRISGSIEKELFEKAWGIVVANNELLRTVFRWQKVEKPVQVVLKEHQPEIRYYDSLSDPRHPVPAVLPRSGLEGAPAGCFDLTQVPFRVTLCKIEEGQYEMIISNHHILYDGWSTGIILREFFAAYEASAAGKEPQKPVKTKFKEYIKWLKDRDQGEQERYWKNYLAGFDAPTVLSVKRPGGKEISAAGNFKTRLAKDFRVKLEDCAKEHKVTPASLLYSAYGILLQKYDNSDDVIFGATAAGRAAKIKGIEDMVGLFINTLPLRVESESGETVVDLLKRVNEAVQKREQYETTPLVDIKAYSPLDSTEELFDSIVVIENYPINTAALQGSRLSIESYSMFEMSNYDLTVAIALSDEIEINFIYNAGLFPGEVVERLSAHFCAVLQEMIAAPGKEVGAVEMLSAQEKKQILIEFNDTKADYPAGKTIPQLFAEQVGAAPDAVASIDLSRAGSIVSLTYKELALRVDFLARFLVEKGLRSGDIAALMTERSTAMVVGILTILKVGAAYLPIDSGYPEERKQYMLMDSSAALLLTTRCLIDEKEKSGAAEGNIVERWQGKTIFIEEADTGQQPPGTGEMEPGADSVQPGASLAYIMYTSGSTGNPKGVMVEHRNVVRLVKNSDFVELSAWTRILQTGAPVFDATTFEIWGSLLNGGRLYLVSSETILDVYDLGREVTRHKINTLWLSSPLFNRLMQQDSDSGILRVSYLLVGGDVLSPEYINLARKKNKALKIINGYGPTENTTFSTTYLIDRDFRDSIPIGRPITNSTAYIVDKKGRLQPPGIWGELLVGGDGLSRGYLNNPDLTADKFLFSSFDLDRSGLPDESCLIENRLYRTGDLCRWLVDGAIEFQGRVDTQVKIRGYRVETGEIERQLLRHDGVKDVVVLVREDKSEEKYLCAYVVRIPAARSEADIVEGASSAGLREYLLRLLPDYMIPSYFVFIEQIPLNPNGKIDIKALPEPEVKSMKEYIPPRDKVEEILADIWGMVLKLDKRKIGIDDDFFELGGHSLRVTKLAGKVHKEFDIKVPLAMLFELSSLRELARYIKKQARTRYAAIKPVEKKEYYPLSSAQKRLYVLQQMAEDAIGYNMSEVFELQGVIDKDKLEEAFINLIHRHESLRTSFHLIAGEPVQAIHSPGEIDFEIAYYEDLATEHLSQPLAAAKHTPSLRGKRQKAPQRHP
ncbi:MAG: amino acid adenylation domain-containing protein, partial [Candidatus Aminicenantes bacterium]|nr:amino acid adenylation domain-containing protein [Candidatus Aminicenantes bacterium]